ncbi:MULTISPECIES: PLP-dependent aminotransferase family protein [unclassified Nocardiopsis]|uniref:MocR-like transcription factor YczR n=1 Tax=unclassified Nocardiopsis TaxID=2649073 RepID=UPI0013572769|nr:MULTISPECIES: PLP-dependent aminotransferase family protein [unclassified Nocardiopsis]
MPVAAHARTRLSARRLSSLLGEWENGPSVYAALADRIRLLVVDGRVPTRTQLPSERELAAELGRSRSTVVAAYRSLRASGHLVSVRGSGSVTTLPPRSASAPPAVDFAHAVPPPIAGLEEIMAEAAAAVPLALDGPGLDLWGDRELRGRIADRYTDRGLPTTPEQVMVTMGGQHAIALTARALVSRADRVLVESPTYPHACEALREAGARLVTTPVSVHGWDGDHLTAVLERSRPSLAYLVPDFHNPTGASMPPELRERVAAVAARTGTVLLVDETTADLGVDRPWDDGPLARYLPSGTVTVGSLSKSVWGGLRLGWVRADTEVIDQLVRARPSHDLGTPWLEQLVARGVLDRLPELLRRRSEQLRERRGLLSSLLRERIPEWGVPAPSGGLSLWVGLGQPLSSALALVCRSRGIALSAGPRFAVDGSQERFVRLPFTAEPDRLRAGVAALADCWSLLPPAPPADHLPDVV